MKRQSLILSVMLDEEPFDSLQFGEALESRPFQHEFRGVALHFGGCLSVLQYLALLQRRGNNGRNSH